MALVRLKQLAQEGATDNQVATWSDALGIWVPTSKDTGAAKNIFVKFGGNATSQVGDYDVVNVLSNGDVSISGHFPEDFASIVQMEIIGIPGGTFTDESIELLSDYGAVGELFNTHEGTNLATLFSGTANTILQLDVASLFPAAAAGDFCGIHIDHKSIGTNIGYLGMHLQYLGL